MLPDDKPRTYGSTDAVMSTPKVSHLFPKRERREVQQQRNEVPVSRSLQSDDEASILTFDSAGVRRGSLSSSLHSSFLNHRDSLRQSIRVVVDKTFRLRGENCDVRATEGTASILNEVFNLWKNLVGAGALGLPSGM